MFNKPEHAVDEAVDVLLGELLGLGDVDERVEELGELCLVDGAVLVVVAHVEDDAQLVVRPTLREEHDRVQELLQQKDMSLSYGAKFMQHFTM